MVKIGMAKRAKILKTLEKFRVLPANENDCFGWKGALRKGLHPRINVDGKSMGAHRAAWLVLKGNIPSHHYIRHICENKVCTNPLHLYISREKQERGCSKRLGRERLSLDLPTGLIREIKLAAEKYDQTVTKYLLRRLYEVVLYEKKA